MSGRQEVAGLLRNMPASAKPGSYCITQNKGREFDATDNRRLIGVTRPGWRWTCYGVDYILDNTLRYL